MLRESTAPFQSPQLILFSLGLTVCLSYDPPARYREPEEPAMDCRAH
jgi:hypothetical protein